MVLCSLGEGLPGTPVAAGHTGGLQHRAAPQSTHTQSLVSPNLFSGTFTAGMGVDTRWGLICPGALGAPHTMHYRWEGAQGGLVAPAEACVPGKRR